VEYNTRYNRFSWSFTGYKSQADAEQALAEMDEWFKRTFDAKEFQIVSTVKQTPYGFNASIEATMDKSDG
jgi:hypothetical protein